MNESKSKTSNMLGLLYAAIAIVAILAIYVFTPVCQSLLELANGNMVHMRCFYTAQGATYLAILLVVCSLVNVLGKKNVSLITLVIGIMLITITIGEIGNLPIGLGVCKKSTMACIKTSVWLKGCGVATIIVSIVQLIIQGSKNKNSLSL